ncbi:LPS export ABC transporter periplasmic protein LptC [bacterium]|nr:LPS export ABC transporter periplasmic protein LptC [bacterium]
MKWQSFSGKQKAYIISISLVIVILLWSFFSAKILTSQLNRKELAEGGDNKQAVVEGVILTETKNQVKYWELYAENGTYNSKDDVASLNDVNANFYKDNQVSMSIQSSQGAYDSRNGTITLFDDTYVVIKDGLTLSADKLVWSGSNKPIFAYGHVIITKGAEFMASADEIEISAEYDNIKIKGNTTSKVFNRSGNGK